MTRAFTDYRYPSEDGLTLYAKCYEGDPTRPTLLCLHGLTRNADDFDDLLSALPDWPAVSVDQRGRARSDHDADPSNYRPDVYCGDMLHLIDRLDLKRIIAIGTSMGGLMTLIMAQMRPGLFEGAIINDIGPDVDPSGLNRLRAYVGQAMDFARWDDAIQAIQAQGPEIFPDFTEADWSAFAHRVCERRSDGRIAFRYDPVIANGLKNTETSAVPPNLWPLFTEADMPMLIIRGAKSDILSEATAMKMADSRDDAQLVTVPNRGHAPLLTEPQALTSIQAFLSAFE